MSDKTDRRKVLKGIAIVPVVAAAGATGAALLSYLKPTTKVLSLPKPDGPLSKPLEVASLDEFPEMFSSKEFTYTQETPEYTNRGKQAIQIPGYIVRVPNEKIGKEIGDEGNQRRGYGIAEHNGQTYSIVVVSAICPHLGCVFQYRGLERSNDDVVSRRHEFVRTTFSGDDSGGDCAGHFNFHRIRNQVHGLDVYFLHDGDGLCDAPILGSRTRSASARGNELSASLRLRWWFLVAHRTRTGQIQC